MTINVQKGDNNADAGQQMEVATGVQEEEDEEEEEVSLAQRAAWKAKALRKLAGIKRKRREEERQDEEAQRQDDDDGDDSGLTSVGMSTAGSSSSLLSINTPPGGAGYTVRGDPGQTRRGLG